MAEIRAFDIGPSLIGDPVGGQLLHDALQEFVPPYDLGEQMLFAPLANTGEVGLGNPRLSELRVMRAIVDCRRYAEAVRQCPGMLPFFLPDLQNLAFQREHAVRTLNKADPYQHLFPFH